MTKIFYLRPLWPKHPPFLFIFCFVERLCLYNREISLAVLLRQTGKTNMTKNCDKIVKCLKNKNWYDIFAISPTPTWNWSVLWPHLHKLHWNHLHFTVIFDIPSSFPSSTSSVVSSRSLESLSSSSTFWVEVVLILFTRISVSFGKSGPSLKLQSSLSEEAGVGTYSLPSSESDSDSSVPPRLC